MPDLNIDNYREFCVNDLTYQNPRKIKHNYFQALPISNKRLVFESPPMKIISLPSDNDNTLSLQFSIDDKDFYDFLQSVDQFNIQHINNKSHDWFQNEFSLQIIKEFYQFFILEYNDEDSQIPYIRVNIPVKNNKLDINIFDSQKNSLSWKNLSLNTEVSVLIEYSGLIFLKKNLLPSWDIIQIKKIVKPCINLTDLLDENNKDKIVRPEVIDEEMIKELSKKPDRNLSNSNSNSVKTSSNRRTQSRNESLSKDHTSNLNSEKTESESEIAEIISDSNIEINQDLVNNLYEKKHEINEILSQVNEHYKRAEDLTLLAKKRADEIKSIAETISHIE